MDRKSRPNVKNISYDISKNNDSQGKARTKEKPNQGKCIQCHECEGFGHIRLECPTYLKKQKKGLPVSSSDDYAGETDDETAKHVTAFTGRYESDEDSCDEDVSYEELVASYKKLCFRSEEVCNIGEEQKRIIAQLQAEKEKLLSTVTDLENEVTLLSSKLENRTKCIRMLNNESDMLDEILQVGKEAGNLKGIGFNYQYQNKQGKNSVTKFIPP